MKKIHYKLIIQYDGADFCGWQIQPGKRTVQGILQETIEKFTRQKIILIGAGRTDAGVHATGQVGAFAMDYHIDPSELAYRLNRMLPPDLAIAKISRVAGSFHPQKTAFSRTYRYFIDETGNPLVRRLRLQVHRRLNIGRLNRAARQFIGVHDFSGFCKRKSLKQSNLCEVFVSRWFRHGGSLIYEIKANRFLHHMIRRLVGTMLALEKTKINLTHLKAFLNNKDQARFSVPAKGLVLTEVKYRRENR